MSDEEGKNTVKKKSNKKRKLLVFLIVIIITQVSFVVVWYIYLRPWTIRDVAEAANVDFPKDGEDIFFVLESEQRNPGFSHDLAGKSKILKGRITNILTYITTLGPLTYIELDDFEYIRLIEWNHPRNEIGDIIEKKVHFKWSHWNENRNVYSPQLDFPVMGTAPFLETITRTISWCQGSILLANQAESDSPINVSVHLTCGEGFPLEFFNCSLRAGKRSWAMDFLDVTHGYQENPLINSINSLSNNLGWNDTVTFSDANHNGLFDDGDYFTFYLTKPEAECAVLTYLFSINPGPRSYDENVLSGICYIVMTNRGLLRYVSCINQVEEITTKLTAKLEDEHETIGGMTTVINITNVIGDAPPISNCECSLSGTPEYIQSEPLINGEVYNRRGLRIEFIDHNNNNVLDLGDHFIISGLENLSEYELYARFIAWEPLLKIKWQTGIGTFTGNLPIIDYREPSLINSLENKTYKIEIDRMYGVPGVNLADDDIFKWFRVRIEKDDEEILPPTDLALSFEEQLGEINISFIDVDDNAFINTGDYFLCTVDGPGEYIFTLDYVGNDYRYEEGFSVLSSQSVSWMIY